MIDDRCVESVREPGMWPRFHQCHRKEWKDAYCKQHHPETIKAREEKARAAWEVKKKKEPWYLLQKAKERIAELEAELQRRSFAEGNVGLHQIESAEEKEQGK
jgi:hypothetical protein